MKKIFFFALYIVLVSCGSSKKTVYKPLPNVTDFQNTITEEGLFLDLSIIASDSLEGRDTGSDGERKAADYLASRYREFGLSPVGDDETFFQYFTLVKPFVDSIQYRLMVDDELLDQSTHSANSIGSFNTLIGGKTSKNGGIVFVGYSIFDEETGVNHFDIDVEGKWMFGFYDRTISSFSTMQRLVNEQNALGAIMIAETDEESFIDQAYIMQGEFEHSSGLQLPYLNKIEDDGAFNSISPKLAATLLGLDSIAALSELESEIKTEPSTFVPYEIPGTLEHIPSLSNVEVQTRNVVAFIEGTDPDLNDEVIVLTSHYDHVGISEPDANGDSINNGADDDGSGTVGLLHAAQAFSVAKQAGAEIKRSILFLNVSGEERGLLGSRYYSDHPIFPIENTIANLNVDMIGRRDNENVDTPDYVYIIGGKIISSNLQTILEQANKLSVNIELNDRYNDLNDPSQFYRRSDHWNFGRLGIPFIFFFNGTHADYHRVSDEVEKIDFEALKKRTKLLFMTAALLANSDTIPQVDNQQFILRTKE